MERYLLLVPLSLLWALGYVWWLVLAGAGVFAVLGWSGSPNWDTPTEARRRRWMRVLTTVLLILGLLSLLVRASVSVDYPRP